MTQSDDSVTIAQAQTIDPTQDAPKQTAALHHARRTRNFWIEIHRPVNQARSLDPLQ